MLIKSKKAYLIRVGFLLLHPMGRLLYQLSLWFYYLSIRLAAPFNEKALLFLKGRKNLFERLSNDFRTDGSPLVWVHCASLGEFEQGRPIVERLKQYYPDFKILLTFFSPSGYEVRKNYDKADYVYYLPLDSPKSALRFIEITKPSLAIFIKYEFWHNYLKFLSERHIPVISVSSIFRNNQIFFKSYGAFQRSTLRLIDHFFVQNEKSKSLLNQININSVTVSGDTRFDRVFSTCQDASAIKDIEKFIGSSKVMVIGSSWPEDMEILLPFIQKNPLKFIIAPHEINRKEISTLVERLNVSSARYSDGPFRWVEKQVLIIDNIGLLSQLYQYGDYAYIGGAFGKGLHNILEAAAFGLPIFFGNKNYKKFDEAFRLAELGGAFPIDSYKALQEQFDKLDSSAGDISGNFVRENLGATDSIMKFINTRLGQ